MSFTGVDLVQFRMPTSTTLQWLICWMIAAVLLKWSAISQAHHASTGTVVRLFLTGLILQYVFAAFWSSFAWIYQPAMIAAAIFIFAVVIRGSHSYFLAKHSLGAILGLSLFCLWIEPWLTVFGVTTNLILLFFHFFGVAIQVSISIAWFILWIHAKGELKELL